jgi:hypothetical protein
VRHIVERLYDDARTLCRAVTVAVAVRAPLECKGGGAHGGVVVLVTTVDTVFKDFKGAPKAQSGYWHSPTFRCESSDNVIICVLTVGDDELAIGDDDDTSSGVAIGRHVQEVSENSCGGTSGVIQQSGSRLLVFEGLQVLINSVIIIFIGISVFYSLL